MPAHCDFSEPLSVWQTTLRVLRHPLHVFVADWNWKAALMSAVFRGTVYAFATVPRGSGALQGVWIELAFRFAIGGFWGSLLQAYRGAEPAWLAGAFAAAVLPATAHVLEYFALKTGGATHIGAGMFLSILVTIGSLVVNWLLMRKGLFVTGDGAGTLIDDFRRIPRVFARLFTS